MEECHTTFEGLLTYLITTPLLTRPVEGEMLYLYLVISPIVVSFILACEKEGVQNLIYYIGRMPKDMGREGHLHSFDLFMVAMTLFPSHHWVPEL